MAAERMIDFAKDPATGVWGLPHLAEGPGGVREFRFTTRDGITVNVKVAGASPGVSDATLRDAALRMVRRQGYDV